MENEFYRKIEKLKVKASRPPIPEEKIEEAKIYAQNIYNHKDEIFIQLSAINLLNAAVKMPYFKHKAGGYPFIKGSVSRILTLLSNPSKQKEFDISFYIDDTKKQNVAYIKIYNIQFSFHQIHLNDILRKHMDSSNNIEMEWEGVRLQSVAEELYDLSKNLIQ